MNKYIITEELLEKLSHYAKGKWVDDVRSRPLQQELQKERERLLKELEQIAQHNWEEIETDEGEMVRMCFCGELIGKIEELRGEP